MFADFTFDAVRRLALKCPKFLIPNHRTDFTFDAVRRLAQYLPRKSLAIAAPDFTFDAVRRLAPLVLVVLYLWSQN